MAHFLKAQGDSLHPYLMPIICCLLQSGMSSVDTEELFISLSEMTAAGIHQDLPGVHTGGSTNEQQI